MDKDEQSAILALLSLQYQIPCQVTKIQAEPSVDPLTTFSTYNSHLHHHHHHHQHHHHHHMDLPLKSVVAIKDEKLLLPNQICSPPIKPSFSQQVKPFAKLSPLKPIIESPATAVVASRVVPSAKPTVVAVTPREKNVIACEDRCKRRRRGNLPKEAVRVMTDWLKSNRYNAYPSEDDKLKMATSLNIKQKQVSNWFINARRRKLTQILHKEGKDSKDYRITRKKKNASLDECRATGSETEVSMTNLSTSSYPSPSSSTSSASDGSSGTGATLSAKQRRSRGGGVQNNNNSNTRHRRQGRLSAMPPTPCSLTSFEGNTSSEEEEDDDEEEERGGGRDFVSFQQRNLEADVRTLDFENL